MLKLLERLLKDKVATEAISFDGEAMPYLPDGTVVTAEIFAAHDEDIYVWAILMPVAKGKEDYYDDIGG